MIWKHAFQFKDQHITHSIAFNFDIFDSLIKTLSPNCKMHISFGINIMDHAELSNDMKSQVFYAII